MTGTNWRIDGTDDHIALATAAEREAFGAATRYARTHDLSTPAESAYLAVLPAARRDILHRFVRGLLRGDPAGLPDSRIVALESSPSARSDSRDPSIPDDPEPLSALDVARLRSIAASLPDTCRRVALVPLPAADGVLVAEIAARHGYDRFRLVGPVYRWSPATTPETAEAESVSHPVDLVPSLEREGAFSDADQADRIRAEVAESVANLALARLAAAVRSQAVGDGTEEGTTDGSPLEAIPAGVPAADAAAAFERIVTDGHPFHPGGKIRRGMTAAEGLAYAPEFTDRIDLRFVAIEREYALETRARATDADRLTDRLFATFGGLEGAVERALPGSRGADEYAVVPVHPLQYHRTIPDRYADQCADGRVVPIPEYAHPATPQLNLRTVVPYDTERTPDGPLPRCKLAIPVQTTNVVRTLSPHAVSNGPQVTDVVRAIERRESLETLGLLAESAASCYHPPGGPHPSGEGFDDARHLSGLLRSPPAAHPLVTDGTVPVAASSLVAESPSTGRPLVCDLIERYGSNTDAASPDSAVLEFVRRYAAVVVPEHLLLLCKYGIALESHLQNSLIVFDRADAVPTATLVRDLGGIRVHGGRLADRDLSIDPYPDSDLDADGEADLHRKLYYALFQNHLAELVTTISHELGVDERACWERIREQCDHAFDRIRAGQAVPEERVRRDERALFDDPATHKALTAMRLRGKRHEYVTSEVSNPLSAVGRQRIDARETEP
ncbi:IucA/IucC family protein [Natrinema salifodinae]|uniref:Siderophore synthetase component n=1 Tax=Natrinema salifodinae TaxID=1202768 RepID=A0A1I0NJF4_9EURY|nr:IucA/IucC family protein [Natrinema salifodinae]SEW01512.1 Siderophore synthetase component [Natrinema salifodinae]